MVGVASIRECLEEGLLHRAVAVIVLRSSGKILLQQRSREDMWHPGRWTLSCTGHVKQGETYEGAAERELGEELGLESPLKASMKLLLPSFRSRDLTEWEWVSLFTTSSDQPPTIDRVELESVEEISLTRLKQMLPGTRLTPDARILLRAFLKPGLRQPDVRKLQRY